MKRIKIICSEAYVDIDDFERYINKSLESIERIGGTIEHIEYIKTEYGTLKAVVVEYRL